MKMRKFKDAIILSMITRGVFRCTFIFLITLAQAQPIEETCFEKCFHAGDQLRPMQVNYFQYPSLSKYDVHYLKLDISVEANSRNIGGSALTRAMYHFAGVTEFLR